MGDFRFSFKATFEMGNVKDECDMWLNWSPRDGDAYPVDHRVIEWLRMNFERGVDDIRGAMLDERLNAERRTRREEEDRILAQAEEIKAQRETVANETS